MIRFFLSILTRFAKTFGCFIILAGFAVAAWLYQTRIPLLESAQYHESKLLPERLANLKASYESAQRLVMKFKGTAEFPAEYAAAGFKPAFPQRYGSKEDFTDLHGQLMQISSGKAAMKGFIINRFENLLSEIQKKLMEHAASLVPASAPSASPVPVALSTDDFLGLYSGMNNSDISARKSTLDGAQQFLEVLKSAAENPDNKKTLENSVGEIGTLMVLLPSIVEEPDSQPPPTPREPVNAEKVAVRLSEIRKDVKRAILSSWALDAAYDSASQAAEEEQGKFQRATYQVRELTEQLHLAMAISVAAGIVVGIFFLLIGDWTQKASTEVFCHWVELIPNCPGSPKEVYDAIEKAIAARRVPGLESSRVFWHEGGALSAKREYLRLARERLVFEICASPFGTGFFISFRASEIPLVIDPLAIFLALGVMGIALFLLANLFGLVWGAVILVFGLAVLIFATRTAVAHGLADIDRVLMKTPLIAPLYELFLRTETYYRIDSMEMYKRDVTDAFIESFQSMFGDKGITLTREMVTKPVMKNLFPRWQ